MHPNDSESSTGGIGGPSDPALVDDGGWLVIGGQGSDADNVERDAVTIPIAFGVLVAFGGLLYGATWAFRAIRAWAVTL